MSRYDIALGKPPAPKKYVLDNLPPEEMAKLHEELYNISDKLFDSVLNELGSLGEDPFVRIEHGPI